MSDLHEPIIELENFWAYQAVVLADTISRHTLAVAKSEAGLNLSQWRVLAAIAEKPGRMAAEVVAITPMDKTIVSRAVASLIEMGLVKKVADKQDKRRSSLTVTAKGRKIYKKIATRLTAELKEAEQNALPPIEFNKALKSYISALRG